MSEQDNNAKKVLKAEVDLLMVYTKDASFESPGSPYTLTTQNRQLESTVNMRLKNNKIENKEDQFEVILTITAQASALDEHTKEKKPVFICELHMAGLFKIKTEEPGMLEYLTEVHCAKEIFPYSREYLANMIMRGGFKPLLLQTFNFDLLFRKKKVAEREKAESKTIHMPSDPDVH